MPNFTQNCMQCCIKLRLLYSTVFPLVISSIVILGLIIGWRKALVLKLTDSMDIKINRVINHTSTSRRYFLRDKRVCVYVCVRERER